MVRRVSYPDRRTSVHRLLIWTAGLVVVTSSTLYPDEGEASLAPTRYQEVSARDYASPCRRTRSGQAGQRGAYPVPAGVGCSEQTPTRRALRDRLVDQHPVHPGHGPADGDDGAEQPAAGQPGGGLPAPPAVPGRPGGGCCPGPARPPVRERGPAGFVTLGQRTRVVPADAAVVGDVQACLLGVAVEYRQHAGATRGHGRRPDLDVIPWGRLRHACRQHLADPVQAA